jgi:CRISPR-associated endonuclease Csn1
MKYRVALSLGLGWLGWAAIRLDAHGRPMAVIRAGVRVFGDGLDPKTGEPLGAQRRDVRARRRRRRRQVRRKDRLLALLVQHGFFPAEPQARRELERLDPYELRARGLDQSLAAHELGRAIFHLNQRRGILLERDLGGYADESDGLQRQAVQATREAMQRTGARTVGEWLNLRRQQGLQTRSPISRRLMRVRDAPPGEPRAAAEADRAGEAGSPHLPPLADRTMVAAEFDLLWERQRAFAPAVCTEAAREALRETLLHERGRMRPEPGRCMLLPEEPRAPAALPSAQRLRILGELQAMRLRWRGSPGEVGLSPQQRDKLLEALDRTVSMNFVRLRDLLDLPADAHISGSGTGRHDIRGNATSALLCKAAAFGKRWAALPEPLQDETVVQLLEQTDPAALVRWLQAHTGIDAETAERVSALRLPRGSAALSRAALARVLPPLRAGAAGLRAAAQAAGLPWPAEDSVPAHPAGAQAAGESLPYYGVVLLQHLRHGTGRAEDDEEARLGRLGDPSLHIGLNQVRLVVNALVERYGRPAELYAEIARGLKRSGEQRRRDLRRQRYLQGEAQRLRETAAARIGIDPTEVGPALVQRLRLWQELGSEEVDRKCPYTGVPLSAEMVLNGEAVVDHILPFSLTLDDSLSNKTLTTRAARRAKANLTPWQAFAGAAGDATGAPFGALAPGGARLAADKRDRLRWDGLETWLRGHADGVSRALEDDYAASHLLRRYLQHLCPGAVRVVTGRLTALLRQQLGLNDALGREPPAHLHDYRRHAVDACVVGITDEPVLRRLSRAAERAREAESPRLLEGFEPPWPTFVQHVRRAAQAVCVSHRPAHGHQGALHRDTAYGLRESGEVSARSPGQPDRQPVVQNLNVIPIADARAAHRHGLDESGRPRAYKGYKSDSNCCVEIVADAEGRWQGEALTTFDAYDIVRRHGTERLRHPSVSASGKPLVMRLFKGDCVRVNLRGQARLMRVRMITQDGRIHLCEHNEADVKRRMEAGDKSLVHTLVSADSTRKWGARRATVSPLGEVRAG